MTKPEMNSGQNGQDNANPVNLPYFDYLLAVLKAGNESVEKSFGRHVHWGYWENPKDAGLSDEAFAEAAEDLSGEVCKAGQVENGLKVLDVGCGFGGTVAHINERFVRMGLTGLNLDGRQLERARTLVIPMPQNSIHFQQGNVCALPFPDKSFDVVLAVECIFHFPSREQFFQEAHRVLKPGGHLALSDFVATRPMQTLTKLTWLESKFYGKCNLQYTHYDYLALADGTGFNVLVERDITKNTIPTYDYIKRLARKEGISNKTAMFETLAVEVLSRLGLLRYYVYGFGKK